MTTQLNQINWVCDVQSSITMGGGSGGGGGEPANTTSNNTETVIQQAPAYTQQYISNLLGQAAASAAQPYQQFPGQQVAGFTDPQTQAFSQIENLTGNGTGGTAAAQGTLANNSAAQSANSANSIYGAGSPYLQAAAGVATPQGISSYMSPYLNNAVQGLETSAQQNWNQFTAPSINNSFISAGQAGSGRNAQVIGQQASLADQALTGQIGGLENTAYTTAGNQAATQAGILQNTGTGLGNLAATQSGAQGAAATNLANTANTVQNTGITGASALQDVGQQQQNLAQQNINTAESNFNAQNLWPETQESFMNSIINGLPSGGSSTSSAGQTPTTTNQIGSTSPLSSLAGSLIGAGALSSAGGGKKGGLVKHFAQGGSVSPPDGIVIPDNIDITSLLNGLANISPQPSNDTSAMSSTAPTASAAPPDDIQLSAQDIPPPPRPNDIPSSDYGDEPPTPLHAASQFSDAPTDAPLDGSITSHLDSDKSPSSTPLPETSNSAPFGETGQARNYQLLSMAAGLLKPTHGSGESLGNALTGYVNAGYEGPKYQEGQQDVISKQLGNASNYAGLARQNLLNQSLGFPTVPLPNIPGLSGYAQKIQQSMGSSANPQSPSSTQSAVTTPSGQMKPIASSQMPQGSPAPQGSSSGSPMNIMQALQIANGRVQANEDQKYQAVTTLQAAQFPVPATMAEEAKQYAQDTGKLANAQNLSSAEAVGKLPSQIAASQANAAAEGAQRRQTATLEASQRPHDITLSDGTTIHTNDLDAAHNAIQGLRQFNPQQQDLMKEDVSQLHEMQPNYEAAQNGLAISSELRELGNIADQNPWTRGGPLEAHTQAQLDRANDLVRRLGGTPVSDKELASAIGVNKLQTQLTSQATKLLGSREAAQIYQYQLKAQPGQGMPPAARNMMLNIMDQNFNRVADRYNTMQKAIAAPDAYSIDPQTKSYKTAIGAVNAYDKVHPSTEYSQTAMQQSGMSTPKFSSPSDPAFQKLPKGAHFVDDQGVTRIKN